jgi:hypothetical protein
MTWIANGESGSSVRTKLNSIPNDGTVARAPSPLPFFGAQTNTPWVRPPLTTFSTFLNQSPVGLSTAVATDQAVALSVPGLPLTVMGIADDVNGGGCLTGVLKSMGSPPWTITAAVAAENNTLGDVSSLPYFSPIILRNSATKKAISLNWWGNSGTTPVGGSVRALHYSDTDLDQNSDGFVGPAGRGFTLPSYWGWFRIQHDGIDLHYSISADGLFLMPELYSEAASYLGTIDQAGTGFDRQTASNFAQATILWSWVES